MAIGDIADEYFTHDSRLASFQIAQSVSKRRASNASTKAPKSLKWPHKSLSPEVLAKAGFFFHPTQTNPDNVACFLCHRALDGWEQDDDPLAEHIKHSPDCGWAIVASIEQQDEELCQEYPASKRMMDARKATFGSRWPHEGKKGWKCKTKQLVDAGWKYTPTPESDDMATCAYCQLGLDGWEPSDRPMDEHFNRSPDCAFFTLINNYKQDPVTKKTKSKRVSKASRLSTQSALTVDSEAPSHTDFPAEEDDSIITTATNSTSVQGKKITKAKKSTMGKGKKSRAKTSDAVEVVASPEPEDGAIDVKVDLPTKTTKSRKRKSENVTGLASEEVQAPPAKRRGTRTTGSILAEESIVTEDIPKPAGRKGRASKVSRKASTASVVSLRAPALDEDELDRALEADLERPISDDEPERMMPPKKPARQSKIPNTDHAMFSTEPIEVDEAAIDAELHAMQAELKVLPKARAVKGKQPRKVSVKQQGAAAKKAMEAEAEARRVMEEEGASQAIEAELDHSVSMQHSSPVIQNKKQRVSRQPANQRTGRTTRASALPVDEDVHMKDGRESILSDEENESGNETDASMMSQATVVKGGSTRRGSTLKKTKAGKKGPSRHIEEIVHQIQAPHLPASPNVILSPPNGGTSRYPDEGQFSIQEQVEEQVIAPSTAKPSRAKAAKPRGRPPKAVAATPEPPMSEVVQSVEKEVESAQPTPVQYRAPSPPRLSSPPPKELTPSQSPQSSDAENHPPSSKPSAATRKTVTPQSHTRRIPLADSTPLMSPSKRNVIAGLQSTHPWTSADLDLVFFKSPNKENAVSSTTDLFGPAAEKAKNGDLTSPEKSMTVEEWIHYNATLAEEKLKDECERMVGAFEKEGTRAMLALEGVECID